MVDLYLLLLEVPDAKIAGQTFNAGFQNMSIMEIAQIVKRVVEEIFPGKGDIPIVTTPTDDIRSYHVNSDKIRRVLGFQPKRTVEDAVRDLCAAFKAGKLPDSMNDTFYFNVRRLKEINAK
jgi:nucleoside-diphosphate-sugar epimerase